MTPTWYPVLLATHVAAGSLALVGGPVARWTASRSAAVRGRQAPIYAPRVVVASTVGRSGYPAAERFYVAAALGTAVTAVAISTVKVAEFGWLLPMGVVTAGLVLAGRRAAHSRGPGWVVAHGYGGSYIALVTALLVVAARDHSAALEVIAWVVPTGIGVPLIVRAHHRPIRHLASS